MNMKRMLLFFFALVTSCALAQTALPNLTYNASLNAACATPNSVCSGGVFTSVSTLTPTGQTGTALDIPSANYAVATVTVSGTYSGATINFDFSDPSGGVSYFQEICARTDVNVLEASEVLPSNQTRSWQCPIFATYRFRVRISAISSGSINTWITVTQASVDPSPTESNIEANVAGVTDPCQNTQVQKSSAVINVTGTTAVELVAAVAGKTVYVCGGSFTIAGLATTAGTVLFETGTKVTNPCDTSTSTRTGAYVGTITAGTPLFVELPSGSTQFSSIAAGEICVLATGTGPSVQGYISYVQQ